MSENKSGYSVAVNYICKDNEGKVISNTENEWYGFERIMANEFVMDVVKSMVAVIDKYNDELKKAGVQSRR